MSTPVVAALPAIGNVIASATVAASAQSCAVIDNSSQWCDYITPRVTTGATASGTNGLSVNVYVVEGTTTTLGSGVSAAGTSLTVASGTGFAKGMKIGIGGPGASDSTNVGEVRTISNVSGTTITIDALQNAHASGAVVYLLVQTPYADATGGATRLGGTAGSIGVGTAANITSSEVIGLYDPLLYYVQLSNLDAAQSVTVALTARAWTSTS